MIFSNSNKVFEPRMSSHEDFGQINSGSTNICAIKLRGPTKLKHH